MIRFFAKVEINQIDDCWRWTGAKVINLDRGTFKYKGKNRWAYRWLWEQLYGAIPPKHLICHKCDNPICVNPYHLFMGTYQDNVDDMFRKGREKKAKGSKHGGAKLTEEDIPKIHQALREGLTQKVVAKQFNVSKGLIQLIVAGKLWKHVEI